MKGPCKLDGCERPAVGKSYCARHYKQWRRGALPKGRYKTCTGEGCRKPRLRGSKCADHAGKPAATPEAPAPPTPN